MRSTKFIDSIQSDLDHCFGKTVMVLSLLEQLLLHFFLQTIVVDTFVKTNFHAGQPWSRCDWRELH